ncbi:uncharacterized protein BHQ10_001164 [Talaromyces amestolkiae]|uniref:Uncharacterized protein n=1 Tax=Talaromyces amestolkiae TaxID=1196081 RepID=A0A364KNM4_TALAM|nr:uncharacterized protein BHQ10_001164 [Talaromyces amestolkiae]RAO65152.1 hypothetical protein BHQ10_001164 [Talaromyces amestolkiae]
MAPLPFPEPRFRSPPPPASVKSAASAAIHQLGRFRVLVYILLGTSAAFSFGFLIWKLGSLFRQFTLGRILRERKPVETRYIKTWYGWVPQDRYDTKKLKWMGLYSNFKDWFSWDDKDDYSKLWWDSDHGGDQIRRRSRPGSLRSRLRRTSLVNRKSGRIVVNRVTTQQEMPRAPSAVNTYHLSHRPSSAYLTYPLCLKPNNQVLSVDHNSGFPIPRVASVLQRGFREHTSFRYQVSKGDSLTRSMVRKTRQLNHLRIWATRLELGSLQSILPHQSGTLGRPGSPLIIMHSNSDSSQQIDLGKISFPRIASFSEIVIDENDIPRKVQPVHSNPSNPPGNLLPNSKQIDLDQVAVSEARAEKESKIEDVEWRFVDTLYRHLEWVDNECRPGQRGFKFPILPKNWANNGKWLVYTNPCGASVEYMRRYAQCDFGAGYLEEIDRQKGLAIVHRKRLRAESIETWRAAINKARGQHGMARVRSAEIFTSSTEDTPDAVIDPANWMLRRPPQGFEMPSRQKTAYWYGGIGEWAKLEEWQVVGKLNDDPADAWKKRMDVFASSQEAQREFLRNHAEVVCS